MKSKTKTDWRIVIGAIIALVILECFAMYKGLNGTMFSLIIALIAGLAGWSAPQLKTK